MKKLSAFIVVVCISFCAYSQNVGIGTPTPAYPLQIASGSSQYPVALNIMPTTHAFSRRAALELGDWALLQDLTGFGTKDFALYQISTFKQRIVVATNGNVGIGTVTPNYPLHLATGSAQYPTTLYIEPSTHATSKRAGMRFDDWEVLQDLTGLTNTKDFAIFQISSSLPRMVISTNGNVGIGDNNPSAKLVIENNSSSNAGLLIRNSNTANVFPAVRVINQSSDAGINVQTYKGSGIDIQQLGFVSSALRTYSSAVLNPTIYAQNDSAGMAIHGQSKKGISIYGEAGFNGGTGVAGKFENKNILNSRNVLEVTTNGSGTALNINSTDTATNRPRINVDNAGNGVGLNITSKSDGIRVNTNFGDGISASTKFGTSIVGIAGENSGAGFAGQFYNVNASNGNDVLRVNNLATATGSGIYVTHNSPSNAGIKVDELGTNGNGLIANANNGIDAYAIWATSTNGYAGYFQGRVNVNGNLSVVGTLSKTMGTFKIDHPQDPQNKYLIHSFVESPDMMNVYNGNITTNDKGEAIVQLPGYFEAENIDFKYQLTIVDENNFAMVRVAKKIENNQFVILTDKPNIKVSWQVTGVRNDVYAQKHRVVPEEMKAPNERGKYLTPLEHGQPITKSVNYDKKQDAPKPEIKSEFKTTITAPKPVITTTETILANTVSNQGLIKQ